MSPQPRLLVPNDGRSKRYGKKKTTQREHIQMGDRVITLFRYTKNETRYKTHNWYARCYLDGATRQISTKEEDVKKKYPEQYKLCQRFDKPKFTRGFSNLVDEICETTQSVQFKELKK